MLLQQEVRTIVAVLYQQRDVMSRVAETISHHDTKANHQYEAYNRNGTIDPDISMLASCLDWIDVRIRGFESIAVYAHELAREVSWQSSALQCRRRGKERYLSG